MFDESIHSFQVNENQRIIVHYDCWADNPLHDWDFEAGMFPIGYSRDYTRKTFTKDYMGVASDVAHLLREIEYHDVDNQVAIEKHMGRSGFEWKQVTLYGSSRGNWAEVIVYAQTHEDYKGMLDAFRKYFRGDVYVLSLQDKKTYVNQDDSSDTHSHWETCDSIGSVYCSDDWDNQELADYFGMKVTPLMGELVG